MTFTAEAEASSSLGAEPVLPPPAAPPASDRSARAANGTFARALRDHLAEGDVRLVAAELGRQGHEPVWMLTLEVPSKRIVVVRAPAPERDPFALELASELARKIFARFL